MTIDFRSLFTFQHDGSLKDRLLTAMLVLAGAFLLSFLAVTFSFGRYLCLIVMVVISLVCCFEVARLFARDAETLRYQPIRGILAFLIMSIPSGAAGWAAIGVIAVHADPWACMHFGVLLGVVAVMVYHVVDGRSDLTHASDCGARWSPAFALVSVCGSQLILIASLPFGVSLLWWMVAVVALNDAAAYFVGRSFGRLKLAPALSPNKTIEGSLAGLVVGSLAGVFFWQPLLGFSVSTGAIVAAAASACVAAQAADLSKSYLKRLRGVKDTGALFPGHGGVLDRFDGLIGASPVMVIFLLGWGLC